MWLFFIFYFNISCLIAVILLCSHQCPTLARTFAVICVFCGQVVTLVPALKVPLRWISTRANVMQVHHSLTACAVFAPASVCHHVFGCSPRGLIWLWICFIFAWFYFCPASSSSSSAAIEAPVAMPLACRCMNGGTCYTDEGGLPKCKWVSLLDVSSQSIKVHLVFHHPVFCKDVLMVIWAATAKWASLEALPQEQVRRHH